MRQNLPDDSPDKGTEDEARNAEKEADHGSEERAYDRETRCSHTTRTERGGQKIGCQRCQRKDAEQRQRQPSHPVKIVDPRRQEESRENQWRAGQHRKDCSRQSRKHECPGQHPHQDFCSHLQSVSQELTNIRAANIDSRVLYHPNPNQRAIRRCMFMALRGLKAAARERASHPIVAKPLESSLYSPVKRYLEKLGFQVKGEICGCDLVALREDGPALLIVGELKLSFNLELLLQGIDRSSACDETWLAVRTSARGKGRERDPRVRKLCRLLGFGLLGVSSAGRIELLVQPGPWRPRRDPKRRSQLVEEHRRRIGDPVSGGSSRSPIMTAYRQQALLCAALLANGSGRPRDLKAAVPDAPKILLSNVYDWFVRLERGVYALTDQGRAALIRWPQTVRANGIADATAGSVR
jgi:hypothetical protein